MAGHLLLRAKAESSPPWNWLRKQRKWARREGLTTAGYLYERLGRGEDAEKMYEQSARRYEDPVAAPRLLLSYRSTNGSRPTTNRAGSAGSLKTLPEGLQPAVAIVAASRRCPRTA